MMPSKEKCKHGPTNTFTISSPIGALELISCPRGIHQLTQPVVLKDEQFNPQPSIGVEIIEKLYKDNGYTYRPALQTVEWLRLYFQADPSIHTQPLPPICLQVQASHTSNNKQVSFSSHVRRTLAEKVGFGQTVSYGQLACLAGSSEKSSRAVGQVMRNNPFMILVPCHRVILSSGAMGNYSGGTKNYLKEWLLTHEGVLKT